MFIQTEDLVKAYKERNAVNGVSIRVDQGQIVGVVDAAGRRGYAYGRNA